MYTTVEALLITKQVELIKNKEFATVAFNPNDETFVVSVTFLRNTNIYSCYRAQIALLIQDNTPTAIPYKYFEFANIFSLDLAAKLSKHTGFNNYPINLVESK